MTKVIGIDASRAFSNQRTGIEEYSLQVIRHLADKLTDQQVVLYARVSTNYESGTNIRIRNEAGEDVIKLPQNWKVKVIKWPFFWTQIGLSLELFFHPVDVFFVPSHVVPFVHPRRTIVTVHGLEYEFFPEGYSFWEKLYMRWSIKASCRWAKKIIAVSENTKKDLIKLYKVPEEKMEVVYEGIVEKSKIQNPNLQSSSKSKIQNLMAPYFLFIGRLEARKNIIGIIQAFEILREKHNIPHRLILAGKPGFGYQKIADYLSASSYSSDIEQVGFVSEAEKQKLLRGADVFLFPSFYEGFGLPILEAQSAGVPLITSNASSMREISTNYESDTNIRIESCALVDPRSPKQIAEATYKLISDKAFRDDIIEKGLNNVKRFSWEECSNSIAKLLHG